MTTPGSKPRRGPSRARSAPHDRSRAADQPRQLPEAAADAVGDEIDQTMLEHQHQLAALTAEMSGRKNAGPRCRDQVRNPECRAEHAGALKHGWCHHLLDNQWGLVFLAQAGIAIEYREGDKGAALMADRAEIAVGDQAEGLFAAVVGMYPPADVGQQAGSVAQATVFFCFAQLHDADQPVGPRNQFLRMMRRS